MGIRASSRRVGRILGAGLSWSRLMYTISNVDPDTSLQFLPGIGPQRAALLAEAGFHTLRDLLWQVPRCLGPAPDLVATGPLPPATEVRVRARLIRSRPSFGRGRRGGLEATWQRADGRPLRARFFQAGYLRQHLIPGEWYELAGRTDATAADLFLHPSFTHLKNGEAVPIEEHPTCRVAYRIPEGFGERQWQRLIDAALEVADQLGDPCARLDHQTFADAIRSVHRPVDPEAHERARRILAAGECEALAWRLHERRHQVVGEHGQAWRWNNDIDTRARARLPFTLSAGQEMALTAIRRDLQQPQPMYRLLHGDVGSGKTALALLAALAVIADGGQVLMLAPTGVLADQHFRFVRSCLEGSRVRSALVTGATPEAERSAISADLANGSCHLAIGTHVLLDERFRPQHVGLVVIDEQHRFGVDQRATMAARRGPNQNWQPDLLLMTATPIPRTLALTVFGDLAVVGISGLPPGRGTVRTIARQWTAIEDLVAALHEEAASDGRAIVICPLREASDHIDAADAIAVHRQLHKRLKVPIALVHGGLSEVDKLAAIASFSAGTHPILVGTTVIEVGIDIPQADRLLVLDADRFGLASLHQLRGRIGRGGRNGRCIVFHRDAETPARLTLFASTSDGMEIAEADLAERGPGSLLGTSQHGQLRLRVVDVARDLDLIQEAHTRVASRFQPGQPAPAELLPLIPAVDHDLGGG
jgi:ATP-dependent DNA helicase RecG